MGNKEVVARMITTSPSAGEVSARRALAKSYGTATSLSTLSPHLLSVVQVKRWLGGL
jgi:hypothetical protein